MARLRPGATLAQARTELGVIASHLAAQYPDSNKDRTFAAAPLTPDVGGVGATLWLLFGAVTLVLLIACANIASLLLARAMSRGRELAMRAAHRREPRASHPPVPDRERRARTRRRRARRALRLDQPEAVRRALARQPAARGGGPSRLACHGVHAARVACERPVVRPGAGARRAPRGFRARASRRRTHARRRVRAGCTALFVIAEIALAMVLLACAGTLGRTLWHAVSLDPGVNVHNVITARTALSPTRSQDPGATRAAWGDLLDQRAAGAGRRSRRDGGHRAAAQRQQPDRLPAVGRAGTARTSSRSRSRPASRRTT